VNTESDIDIGAIEFHELPENAPIFKCTYCGAYTTVGQQRFMAEIALDKESSDTYNIVACSAHCMESLNWDPLATEFLHNRLAAIRKMRG
jgi:hypothetical protein